MIYPEDILSYLVQKYLLTEEEGEQAYTQAPAHNMTCLEYLLEKNYIDAVTMQQACAQVYKIPGVKLSTIEIDLEATKILEFNILKSNKILPLQKKKNQLLVGIVDPVILPKLKDFFPKYEVKTFILNDKEFKYYLEQQTLKREFETWIRYLQARQYYQDLDPKLLVKYILFACYTYKIQKLVIYQTSYYTELSFFPHSKILSQHQLNTLTSEPLIIRYLQKLSGAENQAKNSWGEIQLSNILPVFEKSIYHISFTHSNQRSYATLSPVTIPACKPLEKFSLDLKMKESLVDYIKNKHGILLLGQQIGDNNFDLLSTIVSTLKQSHNSIVNLQMLGMPSFEHIVNLPIANTDNLLIGIQQALLHTPDVIILSNLQLDSILEQAMTLSEQGIFVIGLAQGSGVFSMVSYLMKEHDIDKIMHSIGFVIVQKTLKKLCHACKNLSETRVKPKINTIHLGKDKEDDFYHTYKPEGCELCNYTGYKDYIVLYQGYPIQSNLYQLLMDDKNLSSALEQDYMHFYLMALEAYLEGELAFDEIKKLAHFNTDNPATTNEVLEVFQKNKEKVEFLQRVLRQPTVNNNSLF